MYNTHTDAESKRKRFECWNEQRVVGMPVGVRGVAEHGRVRAVELDERLGLGRPLCPGVPRGEGLVHRVERKKDQRNGNEQRRNPLQPRERHPPAKRARRRDAQGTRRGEQPAHSKRLCR